MTILLKQTAGGEDDLLGGDLVLVITDKAHVMELLRSSAVGRQED